MLEKLKRRLGLTTDDQNVLLQDILDDAEARLCVLLGGVETVPDALSYIVREVAVKRYNRIGSEGTSSHTVEGEAMSWNDDDFAEFADDIAAWKTAQASIPAGKLRIL